jgi:uncharacterized membrane protein
MKNRNTKDPGENHIYSFVLSNLFLFVGIFFSLNTASEVAILFYSLATNLFFHWLGFYTTIKKKISHFSEYYNNLIIAVYCIASAVPVFLLLVPLVLEISVNHWTLLFVSLAISYLFKYLLKTYFGWETITEKLMNRYRMSIEKERDDHFLLIQAHLDRDPEKFADYIEKSQMYDDRIEEYLKKIN